MSQFIHSANIRQSAEFVSQAEVLIRKASNLIHQARSLFHDDVVMGADPATSDGRRVIDFDRALSALKIQIDHSIPYFPFDTSSLKHFEAEKIKSTSTVKVPA